MTTKRPRRSRGSALAKIEPLVRPVVKPVLERLDKHERVLEEIRDALDVQFKRTAAIQAQLDKLISSLSRSRR